ncbi:MAG: adenylosuccinate lyase, partial [Akkermansia muciniphila]|nr:adenylosuccinate lyase [Akkermansia muciniphila]
DQMDIYEPVIRTELNRYLPFLMTTTIMMAAVKRGVGREEAHEVIKEHAVAVSDDLRHGRISGNDLLDRLGNDARLRLSREEIQQIYDANAGDTGMATAQVDGFCAMVDELATRFPDGVEYAPGAIL